jgi:hypothetical protein
MNKDGRIAMSDYTIRILIEGKKKSQAFPITGRGGPIML